GRKANAEVIEFSVQKEFKFNVDIKDSDGNVVDATVEFIDADTEEKVIEVEADTKRTIVLSAASDQGVEPKSIELNVKEGKYNVKIKPKEHTIKEIEVHEAEVSSNVTEFIDIDEVNETGNLSRYVKVYAIDPTKFNFTNATVTVTATGTELYKCKEWNFSEQSCYGEWVLFKTGLVPGQEYSFVLTPEDPGFGEIIAIEKAEHRDENRTFIEDIYNETKELDGVWSPVIPVDHYVRVWFEKNLTSDKDITVYARSNSTARIEVYEQDMNVSVAVIEDITTEGYYKTFLTNLSVEQDVFDLRIIGYDVEFDWIVDPPEITTIVLNSSSNTNTTSENLTCYTDQDDNASLKVIKNWFRNGTSLTVLNMPFEGNLTANGSTQVRDYSPYTNNGTVYNATWNSTGGYDGKGAYEFDGIDDVIIVPQSSSLEPLNQITVSVWFKRNGAQNSWAKVLWYGNNTLPNYGTYGYEFNNTNDDGIRFKITNSTTQAMVYTSLISDNTWYHMASTYNGSLVRMYLDGVEVDSIAHTGSIGTYNGAGLGIGDKFSRGNLFTGSIDDVMIFNTSLSATQIAALYNNRTDLIVSDETTAGEQWMCEATANNGSADGSTVQSNNLLIQGPSETPPSVTLDQPPVDYFNDTELYMNITFNATVADDNGLMNCSLWHNISGTFALNQTQLVSGTSNETNFNISDLTNTTFIWNIYCYDTASQLDYDSNRTVTLNWTETPPTVNLDKPDAGYSNDSGVYVDIVFNATVLDNNGLVNCSLWHNLSGAWAINQTELVSGTSNETEFNISNLANMTFFWNIECYDDAGQSTFGSANRTVRLTQYMPSPNPAIAWLQGNFLDDGSTNLNVATLTTLNWSSSRYHNQYFSHSADDNDAKLTVLQDGDYFLSLTIPVNSTDDLANARTVVEAQVFVNDVKQAVGVARSSYIRGDLYHFYSSDHLAVLLEDLSINDEITIKIQGVASLTPTVNVYKEFSLYVESIPDEEVVFSGTGTETNDTGTPTNLNPTTEFFMKWTEKREDPGYSHEDATSPQAIVLDDAGQYFVTVNIPVYGPGFDRTIVQGRVMLDGQVINGGLFRQTYIRDNTEGNFDSSGHWAGLVNTTTLNQVLTIGVMGIGNSPGSTVTAGGENATIFIQKLPEDGIYHAEATQVTGATPDDWNPATPEEIVWATDNLIDTSIYTHSTGTNSEIITVEEDGDYLVALNGAFQGTGARENPRMNIEVNGVTQDGAWSQTGYIRDQGNDEESSDSLVYLLNLSAGDNITVTMVQDVAGGLVDESTPTTIMLWKKSSPNGIPV
ncbi:LamG domain-containing protein, partial [Nanoarchaeota archaeon]